MHRTLFGLIIFFLLGFGITADAQTPSTASDQTKVQTAATEAELRDLIKTLESEAARKKLISQLNALMAAKQSASIGRPASSPQKLTGVWVSAQRSAMRSTKLRKLTFSVS